MAVMYGAPAMPLAMNGLILATYLPAVYADAEGFGLALGAMGFIVSCHVFSTG